MIPNHKSWWDRLRGGGPKAQAKEAMQRQLQQQLMQQSLQSAGQHVSPVVVINPPPGMPAVGWSRFQVCPVHAT